MSGTQREDLSMFYCCRQNKFATNLFFATLNIFMLLTVTCISMIHRGCSVPFPWQRWLCEYTTILRYAYTDYLFPKYIQCLSEKEQC